MNDKAYKAMYERYCDDYSKGLRDWQDFANAVIRLNQLHNSSIDRMRRDKQI